MDSFGHRRTAMAVAVALGAVWSAWVGHAAILPELQDVKELTVAQLGELGGVGFTATIIGQLAMAPLGDRLDPQVLACSMLVVFIAGMALFASAEAWPLLVVARAASGVALGAVVPVITAEAMRRSTGSERTRSAGWLQAGTAAGLAAGPAVVLALTSLTSPTTAVLMTGTIGGALAAVALLMAPGHDQQGHLLDDRPPTHTRWNRRMFVGAVLISSAFMAAVGAYDTLWSRFVTDIGASETAVAVSYIAFAVPFALVAPAASRWIATAGIALPALAGGTSMLAAIIGYAAVTQPWPIAALGVVESSGQALVSVAAATSLSASVPPNSQAKAHGLSAGFGTAIAASMAVAAGRLYEAGGPTLLFGTTAAVYAALLIAGILTHPATHPEKGTL